MDRIEIGSAINPNPIVLEESELIVNEFLSPSKLQLITNSENLHDVTTIEMIVNTSHTTLGNFGQYLPSLTQLKLNDSVIPSVRDIGTSLSGLTVLWMSRCSLNDVDGIASLQNLHELYMAFNNITDLSPISFLDSLEVLDLDNNEITDLDQMDYLATMPCLTTLTLVGNPLVNNLNMQAKYRVQIIKKLPKLMMLDDISTEVLQEDDTVSIAVHDEDVDIVTAAIKEGVTSEFKTSKLSASSSNDLNVFDHNEYGSRPSSSATHSLPETFNSRPNSAGSEGAPQDEVSALTIGPPICGNPISSLRNRRTSQPSMIKFLNLNKNDRLNSKSIRRPTTAIGLQRPTRKIHEDHQYKPNNYRTDYLNHHFDLLTSSRKPSDNTDEYQLSDENETKVGNMS